MFELGRKCPIIIGLVFLFTFILAVSFDRHLEASLPIPDEGVIFSINAGESVKSIAARLKQQRIVSYPCIVSIYSRIYGLDSKIKRGEYNLTKDLSIKSMISKFVLGKVIEYSITFPEGITLRRALGILKNTSSLDTILSGPKDSRLYALTGRKNSEGMFLPETYRYSRGDSDFDILSRAHEHLNSFLELHWYSRKVGLPYKSAYEALILASIIEKETGWKAERNKISGVFVRRLSLGMRLQADPTIIYGLGESFDGNIRRIHLTDISNKYNTYKHNGLPPTPIAFTGKESILAAFSPDSDDTLYFVADGSGGHVFTSSLEAHREAVKKYQLSGSSSRPKMSNNL